MWLALFLSCLLNYGVLQKALDSFRMEVRTAFFCDFVKTPDEYADKVIRIRVAYHTNEHGAWISSAACDEKTIPVTIDCDDDTACRDRSDKIYKVIEKAKLASSNTKSVDLTLIGRLKGPNESGYGHLNKSKYLFLIQEIEAVAGLPVQR